MRTLLFLLLAARVEAATQYHMVIEQTGNPLVPPRREVTVLADGANWCERVDGVTQRLSNDGGKTVIVLDHQLKTWWVQKNVFLRTLEPHSPTSKVRDLVVRASDQPADDTFAGVAARRKYTIQATYTLIETYSGTVVTAKQSITVSMWTSDALTGSMLVPPIHLASGRESLDAALAPKIAAVPGFPLKTLFVATRAYEGGAPQVEMITATVDAIRTVDAPPHAFDRPRDYINQEPVVGAPGVIK
jgi:hypothetical protein